MRKNTKKVDIIIITVILLLIAGGILLALIPKQESESSVSAGLSLSDFNGKRAGITTGSIHDTIIKNHLPDSELYEFNNYSDMTAALTSGRIDYFLMTKEAINQLMSENSVVGYIDEPLDHLYVGALFPKTSDGDRIREQFDEFIADIKADGTLESIYEYWRSSEADGKSVDMSGLTGENGKLIFATNGVKPPVSYIANGNIVGTDPDIAVRFCRKYGYDIEVVVVDTAGIIPGLVSGMFDFAMSDIVITDERKESINFSVPYNTVELYVTARKADLTGEAGTVSADTDGDGNITYKDYKGKRIGILTGSSFEDATFEFLPDSEYLYYDTLSDLILALEQDKIDAFLEDEPVIRMVHIEQPEVGYLSDVLRTDDYSFAFPKNNKKADRIMEQFNDMLSEFTSNGTLEKMKDKWFSEGSGKNKVDLSDLVGTNGTLNVVTVSTNAPFSMISDGELTGYSIELVAQFCRRYGYDCTFDDANTSSSLAGISTGIYDMLAACATVTEERKESMNFSEPIYVGGISLAVRTSDIAQTSGSVEDRPFSYYAKNKKIGAITGGLYEVMIRERYPEAEIMQYNNQPDLAVALGAGVIDAFTCPESSAKDFIKADPSLTYLNEVFMEIPYGFAFEKSADKEYLRDQMNEFLKKLHSDGTYDELVAKWFGEDESIKSVDMSGLTGENGTIRYITAPTMQPFSYIANGGNAGFEVELITRFCREYGYSLKIENGEFASLIPGITSGMYDIASGTIMITEERAESVNFSDVYYTANAVAVVRKENTEPETTPGFFESIADSFEKNFIREDRWQLILDGIGTTCLITVLSALFGSVLAFLICMFRRTGSRLANAISNIYVKLLQGTPIVVLLMILYYVIFGKIFSSVWVAIIGFTLNFGAYASEIMRSGIESIDGGQREAALALGYNENQAFFRFIFPQAAVRFLPVYNGEIVSLLKSTSIVGYIAIQDLTKMSDIIRSRTYEAFFPLIATAIIYFILAWIISLILKFILKKVSPKRKRGAAK